MIIFTFTLKKKFLQSHTQNRMLKPSYIYSVCTMVFRHLDNWDRGAT